MSKTILFLFSILFSITSFGQQKQKSPKASDKDYFPARGSWQHQSPSSQGFDSVKLQLAVQFAIQHESKQSRNMEIAQTMTFGKEPFGYGIGPFTDRGEPTGLIIHKGYIIAEWGEPGRVDMTHSVTKSFLSTVIGLAVDQQLITSVFDTVASYVPPIEAFDGSGAAKDPSSLGQ